MIAAQRYLLPESAGARGIMRVFISSVITAYDHYRDAVAAAVESLGHEVIRPEDFGASPGTPQQACLGGVREADVVVFLVGALRRNSAIWAHVSRQSITKGSFLELKKSEPHEMGV